MPGVLTIDQRFRHYTGTLQQIQQDINTELNLTDLWFIKHMGTMAAGAGVAVWILWERQLRA